MSATKLNISRQTNALMRRLDLEPTMVKELTITPSTVTATVFTPNENGAKHIIRGKVVTETRHYEVRT